LSLATEEIGEDDFVVELDAFEGPHDLLLHLILRSELDVFEISVAALTDQFLAYLSAAERFRVDVATEFLVTAATLLALKSAALLPAPEEDEVDEALPPEAEDGRALLVAALIDYKTFKNVSSEFGARLELEERFFTRRGPRPEAFAVEKNLLQGVEVEELARLFLELESRATPTAVSIAHMKGYEYSVDDKMTDLRSRLRNRKSVSFRELANDCRSKLERIVVLLALLELHKEGEIELRQATLFGNIEVVRADEG